MQPTLGLGATNGKLWDVQCDDPTRMQHAAAGIFMQHFGPVDSLFSNYIRATLDPFLHSLPLDAFPDHSLFDESWSRKGSATLMRWKNLPGEPLCVDVPADVNIQWKQRHGAAYYALTDDQNDMGAQLLLYREGDDGQVLAWPCDESATASGSLPAVYIKLEDQANSARLFDTMCCDGFDFLQGCTCDRQGEDVTSWYMHILATRPSLSMCSFEISLCHILGDTAAPSKCSCLCQCDINLRRMPLPDYMCHQQLSQFSKSVIFNDDEEADDRENIARWDRWVTQGFSIAVSLYKQPQMPIKDGNPANNPYNDPKAPLVPFLDFLIVEKGTCVLPNDQVGYIIEVTQRNTRTGNSIHGFLSTYSMDHIQPIPFKELNTRHVITVQDIFTDTDMDKFGKFAALFRPALPNLSGREAMTGRKGQERWLDFCMHLHNQKSTDFNHSKGKQYYPVTSFKMTETPHGMCIFYSNGFLELVVQHVEMSQGVFRVVAEFSAYGSKTPIFYSPRIFKCCNMLHAIKFWPRLEDHGYELVYLCVLFHTIFYKWQRLNLVQYIMCFSWACGALSVQMQRKAVNTEGYPLLFLINAASDVGKSALVQLLLAVLCEPSRVSATQTRPGYEDHGRMFKVLYFDDIDNKTALPAGASVDMYHGQERTVLNAKPSNKNPPAGVFSSNEHMVRLNKERTRAIIVTPENDPRIQPNSTDEKIMKFITHGFRAASIAKLLIEASVVAQTDPMGQLKVCADTIFINEVIAFLMPVYTFPGIEDVVGSKLENRTISNIAHVISFALKLMHMVGYTYVQKKQYMLSQCNEYRAAAYRMHRSITASEQFKMELVQFRRSCASTSGAPNRTLAEHNFVTADRAGHNLRFPTRLGHACSGQRAFCIQFEAVVKVLNAANFAETGRVPLDTFTISQELSSQGCETARTEFVDITRISWPLQHQVQTRNANDEVSYVRVNNDFPSWYLTAEAPSNSLIYFPCLMLPYRFLTLNDNINYTTPSNMANVPRIGWDELNSYPTHDPLLPRLFGYWRHRGGVHFHPKPPGGGDSDSDDDDDDEGFHGPQHPHLPLQHAQMPDVVKWLHENEDSPEEILQELVDMANGGLPHEDAPAPQPEVETEDDLQGQSPCVTLQEMFQAEHERQSREEEQRNMRRATHINPDHYDDSTFRDSAPPRRNTFIDDEADEED